MTSLGGIDLSGSVAGIPKSAWVAIVGGGLAYGYYRRRHAASTPAVTQSDPTPVADQSGTGAVGGYVDNSTPAPGAPTVSDNASWGRQATNYLIAQNYDPAVSDSAVRKYLASASLSVSEYALIKLVLLKYGPPPEALPQLPADPPATPAPPVSVPGPVTPAPAPAPAPVAPAPSQRRYTVVHGDTLWAISQRFYGSGAKWPIIYNANRGTIGANPGRIYPNQVLIIP